MIVYRIDRIDRQRTVLSGKGAELFGGRWNPVGLPVVYCSESRALAMLEILVHSLHQSFLPTDRILVAIEIPDQIEVKELKAKDLPLIWSSNNNTLELQNFMTPLIQKHTVIKVPSVIVPEEYNIILNPNHNDFQKIKVLEIKELKFDHRFLPKN